jgi:hypothetical protein
MAQAEFRTATTIDADVLEVQSLLEQSLVERPHARIDAYRFNDCSIRVRIIDRGFQGKPYTERFDATWDLLKQLPERILSQVSLLVLLTPDEIKKQSDYGSANFRFENPDDPCQ